MFKTIPRRHFCNVREEGNFVRYIKSLHSRIMPNTEYGKTMLTRGVKFHIDFAYARPCLACPHKCWLSEIHVRGPRPIATGTRTHPDQLCVQTNTADRSVSQPSDAPRLCIRTCLSPDLSDPFIYPTLLVT